MDDQIALAVKKAVAHVEPRLCRCDRLESGFLVLGPGGDLKGQSHPNLVRLAQGGKLPGKVDEIMRKNPDVVATIIAMEMHRLPEGEDYTYPCVVFLVYTRDPRHDRVIEYRIKPMRAGLEFEMDFPLKELRDGTMVRKLR